MFKTAIAFLNLTFLCLFGLLACNSVSVEDYKYEKPKLILEEYFNGTIDAYGIFQNRSGKVVKRFHCIIQAKWEGQNGILDETFYYTDGTSSKRIWKMTKQADGKYVGTASDVIGQASGEVKGNAFQWLYTLELEVEGSKYHVHFDDWMFLMNDKIMLNRSVMKKFGIDFGSVTLTFVKR